MIKAHDLIVCADSGADHVRALGLKPNLVVGDFDSISPDTLVWLNEHNITRIKFPVKKDKTDCELAINEAKKAGAHSITLTGTRGGRFDQTLSHIFLLKYAHKKAISCYISEATGDIHYVEDQQNICGKPGDIVSIIAIEDSRGLKLSGFKYQMKTGDLDVGDTLGISNVLLGTEGTVELLSGSVLVVHLRGSHEKASEFIDNRGF